MKLFPYFQIIVISSVQLRFHAIIIPSRNNISNYNSIKRSTRVLREHLLLYFFRTTHVMERISFSLLISPDYNYFTSHLQLATPAIVETQRVNHSGESEIADEMATLSLDLE